MWNVYAVYGVVTCTVLHNFIGLVHHTVHVRIHVHVGPTVHVYMYALCTCRKNMPFNIGNGMYYAC